MKIRMVILVIITVMLTKIQIMIMITFFGCQDGGEHYDDE